MSDLSDVDTGPRQWCSGRRLRTMALSVVALAATALASAAYLHVTLRSEPKQMQSLPARYTALIPLDLAPSAPTSPRTGELIREGATGAIVQLYGGLNDQPPLSLHTWARLSESALIAKLVRQLNVLPAYPSGIFCAQDDGSYFAVVLSYADSRSTAVKVEATGCQLVYLDGATEPAAWAATSPGLFVTLRWLLHMSGT